MSTIIQGGEFIEERERQLPPETSAGNIAQGATASSVADLNRAQLGAPPVDYDVRSTYDSRPVNAYDFNIIIVGPESVGPVFNLSFQVRQGYVAVVRELHHWFDPAPALAARNDVLASYFINDTGVLDNQNVPVGIESDALLKSFVIVDELQTFTVQLTCSAAIPTAAQYVHLYGNYLLKTGRPPAFEIANPVNYRRDMAIATKPMAAPMVLPPMPVTPAPAARVPMPAPSPAPGRVRQTRIIKSGGNKV